MDSDGTPKSFNLSYEFLAGKCFEVIVGTDCIIVRRRHSGILKPSAGSVLDYLTPVYWTTVPLESEKLPMILLPSIVPLLRDR